MAPRPQRPPRLLPGGCLDQLVCEVWGAGRGSVARARRASAPTPAPTPGSHGHARVLKKLDEVDNLRRTESAVGQNNPPAYGFNVNQSESMAARPGLARTGLLVSRNNGGNRLKTLIGAECAQCGHATRKVRKITSVRSPGLSAP